MHPESSNPSKECQEMFALLSQYLDEELPPETCEQIRSHISGCAPCVEFVNSLKRSIELVRNIEREEQPAPLPAAIREELKAAYKKMLSVRRGAPAGC